MTDALKIVMLPVVATAIFGGSILWWLGSWAVEGYQQIRSMIRTAN